MYAMTLTFGEIMENHAGMQKIGKIAERGFSLVQLIKIAKKTENAILINLNHYIDENISEFAYILIIKKFVKNDKELLEEHSSLNYDKQYYDTRRKKYLINWLDGIYVLMITNNKQILKIKKEQLLHIKMCQRLKN